MNVENTSMEGVTDIKVENESDNEEESTIDLYTDHVIKDEMVIGPVVLQAVNVTYCPEDVPVPKKPKLETTDEETHQVKPQKGMKEDNTEGIISNFDFHSATNIKTNITLKKCNQTTRCKKNQEKYKIVHVYVCHKKRFSCSNNQKNHLSTHLKPYSCSYCDYKCNQKSNLLRHLHTHTNEKPFSCSLCDYKCKDSSNLTTHLRSHTDEKPYSCTFCEYKCRQKGDLSTHLRIHTGDKPYLCSYCDYKCKRKSHLSSHLLRIHTGEKPYSCSYCDYKCCVKGDLSKHFRIHTDEKPYSCSHCEYKSAQKASLTKHCVRRHPSTTRNQLE